MSEFNLFKALETNRDMEAGGVWVEPYGPSEEGFPSFKLGRTGGANSKYEKLFTAKCKPYARQIQANAKNPDEHILKLMKKITIECFVDACMMDWKNVKDRDGNQIAFSKEAAFKLFEQLPALFDDLYDKASSLSTFQSEEVKDEAGN
jgi:hypothetical protein